MGNSVLGEPLKTPIEGQLRGQLGNQLAASLPEALGIRFGSSLLCLSAALRLERGLRNDTQRIG